MATASTWKHFSNHLSCPSVVAILSLLASYKKNWKPIPEFSDMERQHPHLSQAGQHRAHRAHDERAWISSPLKQELSWAHHTLSLHTWPGTPISPQESLSKLFTGFPLPQGKRVSTQELTGVKSALRGFSCWWCSPQWKAASPTWPYFCGSSHYCCEGSHTPYLMWMLQVHQSLPSVV